MAIKIYKYIVYYLYCWLEKQNPDDAYHEYYSILMLSFVMLINVATLMSLMNLVIELIFSINVLKDIYQIPKYFF